MFSDNEDLVQIKQAEFFAYREEINSNRLLRVRLIIYHISSVCSFMNEIKSQINRLRFTSNDNAYTCTLDISYFSPKRDELHCIVYARHDSKFVKFLDNANNTGFAKIGSWGLNQNNMLELYV